MDSISSQIVNRTKLVVGKSRRELIFTLVISVLVLWLLYLISLNNYLLFHSLAEIFTIVVATAVFVLAWNSRKFSDLDYLLFVGISFLFVTVLDLLHTLTYKGIGIIPGYDANLPTQLWIAARYIQSVSLLIAPFFIKRKVNITITIFIYLLVTVVLFMSIFVWQNFPTCYVEGSGLTEFKIISEYVISFILIGAIAHLFIDRDKLLPRIRPLLFTALSLTIAAELMFTSYSNVYDNANLVGHLLRIGSYYFFYEAIIVVGLQEPYSLIFYHLAESNAALKRSRDELEQNVHERTTELLETNNRLRSEISERKLVEQSLRETEEKFQSLVLSLKDVVYTLDGEQRHTGVYGDWVKKSGLTEDFFLGKTAREIFGPDTEMIHEEANARALAGEANIYEWSVPTENEIMYYQTSVSPLRDHTGEIVGLVGIGRDISDLKRAEKAVQELNQELEKRVQKRTKALKKTIGDLKSFGYSVSHDLRAPLRAMKGFSEIILEENSEDLNEDAKRYLFRISQSAERMDALITGLLEFSQLGRKSIQKKEVNLNQLVSKIVGEAKTEEYTNREIVVADLGSHITDEDLIQQVFANLLNNALKFTDKTKHPKIEIGTQDRDGKTVFFVKDNGIGFDIQYTDIIFGVFQRLNPESEYGGIGIGLSNVKRIIEHFGGRIWVESDLDAGTTFYFTLE